MPAVFVSPRIRERQLREALQEALQQQDSQALRQLSDRLVHRHGPVQLQRWMQEVVEVDSKSLASFGILRLVRRLFYFLSAKVMSL